MKRVLFMSFAIVALTSSYAQYCHNYGHAFENSVLNRYFYDNTFSSDALNTNNTDAASFIINTTKASDSTPPEPVYRRSSLYPVLLEVDPIFNEPEEEGLFKQAIAAYNKAPFPDKYNDHRLDISSFKFVDYANVSAEELKKIGDENDEAKSRGIDQEYIAATNKFLAEKQIAKGMVAKWFNRQPNGAFDMSLIHERGAYDASAMQVKLASGSVRGMAMLQDAGEELIKNTFVVVNRMRFVKNEPIARAIRDIAHIAAAEIANEITREIVKATAEATYIATKDGYSVWTVSFLYQLEWDDDIANNFYENMWIDQTDLNPERKALFDNTDIFKLKYIGYEKAKSLVLFGTGRSTDEIIEVATIRNIDKTYVKLQKSFDVFKTKSPIVSINPITAKIGMKEGLEGGDKFDVLEMTIDVKTGLTKYEKVGRVKVDKKHIWDNRYVLSEADTELTPESQLNGSQFSGSKKILPGMLLRQVK